MAVSFTQITPSRIPGVRLEFQPVSQPGAGEHVRPVLLVGQMTTAGTATENVPVRITSAAQARTLFGRGSSLAHMCEAFILNAPGVEFYAVGIDDASGTNATATIQVTHASTAAGTIYLYVAGRLVQVAVTSGMAVNDIASAIEAACDANLDLPIVASVSTDTVTLTAIHDGTIGNALDVRVNYLPGQDLPAGVTLTVTNFASGATDPTLDGITSVGPDEFDWVVVPWAAATQLNAWKTAVATWWGPDDQRMPVVITCLDDTATNLGTFGDGRNGAHEVVLGLYGSPTPSYEIAAALAAVTARVLDNDPALPTTGQPLLGVLPPARADRFTRTQRDALLDSGIATVTIGDDGSVYVERTETTYKTDASGSPDTTWLDVQESAIARRVARRVKARVIRSLSGMKLVDDAGAVRPGSPVASPALVKAEIVAEAASMAADGIIEDLDAFKAGIVVERDTVDRKAVNVSIPVNPVDQLLQTRIVARLGA